MQGHIKCPATRQFLEEGTMEIIEEKGDSLQIYFNVTKSSPETKSHKDWIVLKNGTLTIGSLQLNKQ